MGKPPTLSLLVVHKARVRLDPREDALRLDENLEHESGNDVSTLITVHWQWTDGDPRSD